MSSLLNQLQSLLSIVPKKIEALDKEELTVKPNSEKWSKQEIFGHLCDSALYNWQRFAAVHCQAAPLQIVPYPQADLVRSNAYQTQPIGHLISLWQQLNQQIAAIWRSYTSEHLEYAVVLPDGTPADLSFLINDYLKHLNHHLQQIFPGETLVPEIPANWHITVAQATAQLKAHAAGKPFLTLLESGKMYVEIYEPVKEDVQQPHDQDEIYVVISGSGLFYNNGERRPFSEGDLLYVPAGVEHRFEEFTADFKTWVIFY